MSDLLKALNGETGYPQALYAVDGGLVPRPGATDVRIARFNATADCCDIVNSGAVAAARINLTGFSSTARRVIFRWHVSPRTFNGVAEAGHVAVACFISINATSDANANARLAYTDLGGGGTSTSGDTDLFVVSQSNPVVEVALNGPLTRIDVAAVVTPQIPTNIVPNFLEMQIVG